MNDAINKPISAPKKEDQKPKKNNPINHGTEHPLMDNIQESDCKF